MFVPEDLTRLHAELHAGRGLILVRVDSADDEREVHPWLESNAPQPCVFIDIGGAVDPIAAIQAASRGAGTVVAKADVPEGPPLSRWLDVVNTGRDGLRAVDVPVVWLVPNRILDALAQRAPDLWSWRGGVYEGVLEKAAAPVFAAEPVPREYRRAGLERAWQLLQEDAADFALSNDLWVDPGRVGWGAAASRVATRNRLGGPAIQVMVGSSGVGGRTALGHLGRSPDFTTSRARVIWFRPIGTSEVEHVLQIALLAGEDLPFGSRAVDNLRAILGRAGAPEGQPLDYTTAASAVAAAKLWGLDAVSAGVYKAANSILSEVYWAERRRLQVMADLHGVGLERVLSTLAALRRCSPWAHAVVALPSGVVPDESSVFSGAEVEEIQPVDTSTPAGMEFLTRILAVRGVDEETCDADARTRIIEASGGLPGTLLALARDAALTAIEDMRERISVDDVVGASRRRANRLRFGLTAGQVRALERARMGETLDPEPRASLEHAGALIRTERGSVVAPVLEELTR